MSKAQLSGAVGYTGFIRPSLQCTQQCSLKPGRHAQEAGSYWPKPLDLGAKTTNLRAGPETSNTAMSAQMSPETYNNHCRQDRAEHNLAARTTPLCSHWKVSGQRHSDCTRLRMVRSQGCTFKQRQCYRALKTITPTDLFRSPPHLSFSHTEMTLTCLPLLGRQGAARTRCAKAVESSFCRSKIMSRGIQWMVQPRFPSVLLVTWATCQ